MSTDPDMPSLIPVTPPAKDSKIEDGKDRGNQEAPFLHVNKSARSGSSSSSRSSSEEGDKKQTGLDNSLDETR
eukprot:11683521-Karenia_brevis.AAC.1